MPKKVNKKSPKKNRQKSKQFSILKTYLTTRSTSLFFLILGIIFISFSVIWENHNESKYSFSHYSNNTSISSPRIYPTYIRIEKINLSRPVTQTIIKDNIWEVKDDAVSHLATSSSPGENGNIIFYSHNTESLFGKLSQLQENDTISVVSQDGKNHIYKVVSTAVVSPNDVWILESKNQEELTLYTCYGFADLKRFVVKALPQNQ